jgi:hypothetical protein
MNQSTLDHTLGDVHQESVIVVLHSSSYGMPEQLGIGKMPSD